MNENAECSFKWGGKITIGEDQGSFSQKNHVNIRVAHLCLLLFESHGVVTHLIFDRRVNKCVF